MAYFNQEDKKRVAPAIKAVLKKYGVKGTISVRNRSTLVVTIKEGELDLIGSANRHNKKRSEDRGEHFYEVKGYLQVNRYYASEWAEEVGDLEIANFYEELVDAMKGADWYDRSDSQTDYFDTAYYIDINVGRWNKPYELVK